MTTTHPEIYEVHHLGGETCVTGSCHILSINNGINIMVDCGLSQGDQEPLSFAKSPVPVKELDYLFITHAHLDHIGRIPELIENGFKGEIICTHPTKALLMPMMHDALGFSERSKKEIQKLETKIWELSWGFEYNQDFKLKKGVAFKLRQAGHILGSCFIRISVPGNDKDISIIFSGDLGCKDTPVLPDPDLPDSCDLLILESTYGNRDHQGRAERIDHLGSLLEKALKDNGKVFIPAFSLGRTQEFIYELDRIFTEGLSKFPGLKDKDIPVFIDSPLGLEITKIYSSLEQFWDKEAKKLKDSGDHPIDFPGLYGVKSHFHHEHILDLKGPAIIIAGSGMCTGGRILAHLEKGLETPENDVFFIGYQAQGTTGRKIIQYSKKEDGYIRLRGKDIKLKAGIHVLSGYSAHADRSTLLNWVEAMPEKPKLIKLVHGDDDARKALAGSLNGKGFIAV